MKKNNTDTVLTPAFRRICVGGSLLYMSAYMSLPVLFLLLKPDAWKLCGAFVVGMLMSGPFNAYLGDTYRRKHVFMAGLLGMLIAIGGYLYAENPLHYVISAWLHGACLGMASAAGVTVSIDITVSGKRTRGNELYALMNRIGLYLGVIIGFIIYGEYGWTSLICVDIAFGLIGLLAVMFVYVPFRAPMGVGLINLDRFLLLRALLPAFNVLMLAVACGIVLCCWENPLPIHVCILLVVLSLFVVVPLVKMFVKLSHHCQRGTGNTTFHLAADIGLCVGMAWAVSMENALDKVYVLGGCSLFALLYMALISCPYFKRKRVR